MKPGGRAGLRPRAVSAAAPVAAPAAWLSAVRSFGATFVITAVLAVPAAPAAAQAAPCAAALCVSAIEVDGQPAAQARDVPLRGPDEAQDRRAVVTTATTLADGSVIETPTRPRVRLVLTSANGNTITLQPGARLQVQSAGPRGERYTQLLGEVRFAVTRALGFFEVAHEKFLAAVKGTEFVVAVDPAQDLLRYDWVRGEVVIEHEVQVSIAGAAGSIGGDADDDDDAADTGDTVVVREVLSQARPQLRYRLNPTAYRNLFGNFAEAEKFYTDQLAADRASGDPQQIQQGLMALGSILARIGKPEAAADALAQALAMSATLTQPAREAELARRLGALYLALGQPGKAVPVLRRSLALEEQRAGRRVNRRLVTAHLALGRAPGAGGDARGWVAAAERAIAIMQRLDPQGNRPASAAASKGLADATWAAGDRPRALALYRATLEQRRRLAGAAMNGGIVQALRDLGLRSIEAGERAAGIDYLRQALAGNRQLWDGPRINVAGNLDDLGRAHEQGGEWALAITHYRQAYDMRMALFPDGVNPLVLRSCEALARVSRAAGQNAEAERYASQARDIAAKLAGRSAGAAPGARP